MLGHISFRVSDLARTTAFYDAIMTALGYGRVVTKPDGVGYGLPGTENDRLLLILKPGPVTPPGSRFHLAFGAPSRDAVDRFHAAALQFGGVDEGIPGLRPNYGPTYYAAFVRDPDGYQLEANIRGRNHSVFCPGSRENGSSRNAAHAAAGGGRGWY